MTIGVDLGRIAPKQTNPPEKSQNYRIPLNYLSSPDPLKIKELPSQHSMLLGHQWPATDSLVGH